MNNTFINNLSVLEQDFAAVRCTRLEGQRSSQTSQQIESDIEVLVSSYTISIKSRLLSDLEEENLADNISKLTNFKLYYDTSKTMVASVFAIRSVENNMLPEACKMVANLDDVPKESLQQHCCTFMERLHPFLNEVSSPSSLDPRYILKQFMIVPKLYEMIPDVMHAISCCFLFGHNESYIESIGSKIKHHFPNHRNTSFEHLNEEVKHCDQFINEALDKMYGKTGWKFFRSSDPSKIKFHKISQAVDTLQNVPSSFYL